MHITVEVKDYNVALRKVKEFPRFYIGQEVKTKVGKGILVAVEMPHNAITIIPEKTKCKVWFGTCTVEVNLSDCENNG